MRAAETIKTVCRRCQRPFRYRRRGGRLRYYCDRRFGGAPSCKERERMDSNRQRPSTGRRRGAPTGPQQRDVGRLPQWVQRRIAQLEADLAARKEEIAAMTVGEHKQGSRENGRFT